MWLTLKTGEGAGRVVEVSGERFSIGRDPLCDLVVDDERASRQHAFIKVDEDGTAELHDLGSSNGTFVDGTKIEGPVTLTGGETVRIGSTEIAASATEPTGDATVVGEAPPPPPGGTGPSQSVIERARNKRTATLGVVLGGAAVVIAIVVVALAIGGVFSGGGDDEPDIAEIVDTLRPSTGVVRAIHEGDGGSGTGWVLDAGEGLVVTNAHVVNGGTVHSIGVEGDIRPAELVGVAPCEDLAVLRVEDTDGLETLAIADQEELREGDRVVAVGFPASASEADNLTATEGIVSVARTSFDLQAPDVPMYPNVIQTDTAINPGNSGGPLVNDSKELVGVNSAGITDLGGRTIQGQGYAIGSERLEEILPQLREGSSLAWTGMNLTYIVSEDQAPVLREAGLPLRPGLLVTSSVPGSNAAEEGFGEFPVLITEVNGEEMDGSLPTYCDAVNDGEGQDEATFTVATPDGQTREVTVPFE